MQVKKSGGPEESNQGWVTERITGMNSAFDEKANRLAASCALPLREEVTCWPAASRRPRAASMRCLLSLLIAASLLPLGALLAYQVAHEWHTHLYDGRKLVQNVAETTAQSTAASLDEVERTLAWFAQRPRVRALDAANCDGLFADIPAFKAGIGTTASVDAEGNIVCSSLPASAAPLPGFGGMQWFRRLKEGDTDVISSPFRGRVTQRWIAVAGASIHGSSGAFRGAVVMTIDLAAFQPMELASLPEGGVMGIIDRDGVVVARSSRMPESMGTNIKDTEVGRAVLSGLRNTEVIQGADGIERLYAYQPIAGTNWSVAAGLPTNLVFAGQRETAWRNGIGLLAALAVTGLMAFAVYRRISGPLAGLRDASRAIARGSVHQRAPATGPRELAEMARSFNHMMDRIVETERAAREHQDHYRQLFLASPEAICLLQEGRVVMANPAATRLFVGDAGAGILGRNGTELVHPRDRADAQRRSRMVLSGRSELETAEVEILRADGIAAAAVLTLLPFSFQGKPTVLAMIADVSLQRRLEGEALARRNELERLLNQQVAMHTALAVAHELNQPLGAVSAYCEAALYMLRSGNPVPAKLEQALVRGVEQAHRAGSSLHELIEFLRRDDAPVAPFDVGEVIHHAVELVHRESGDRCKILVRVDEALPPALGRDVQVTKVLVNLLHNAIEAMGSESDQEISISAAPTSASDMAQVSVQDSGPGMTPEMAQQIFKPFFTNKPQGMGLGLVISKALIKAQGGDLWCDPSRAGGGAVFRFTVPVAT